MAEIVFRWEFDVDKGGPRLVFTRLKGLDDSAKLNRLETSVAEIGLMVETLNCLEERGIFTVGDLLQCTRQELLSINDFGENTLLDVFKGLERAGFYRRSRSKPVPIAPSVEIGQSDPREKSEAEAGFGVADRRDEIKALLADLPADYAGRYKSLQELSHEFRTAVASQLQVALNEHIQQMPQDSLDDKQAIASWVNGQLRGLGLAIKCPKTGRPANLVGDKKEAGSEISRFRLEIRDEMGKKTRTFTSRELPELELMEDEPRQEPLVEWSARVRGTRGGREVE